MKNRQQDKQKKYEMRQPKMCEMKKNHFFPLHAIQIICILFLEFEIQYMHMG